MIRIDVGYFIAAFAYIGKTEITKTDVINIIWDYLDNMLFSKYPQIDISITDEAFEKGQLFCSLCKYSIIENDRIIIKKYDNSVIENKIFNHIYLFFREMGY